MTSIHNDTTTTSLGAADIDGARGRAWAGRLTPEIRSQWPAGLDTWLLHCPGAHPFWSWYVVSGCSLRDVPGMSPAQKRSEGMTHELLVLALHPDWAPGSDWCSAGEGRWARHWLKPANLVWQAAAASDEQWCSMVRVLVEAFCSGAVSPDTDHRSCMVELLERELRAQAVAA